MENNSASNPPFFVGQKVVAIRSAKNKNGYQIKKGTIYTVFDIFKCECGMWVLDVGIKVSQKITVCQCFKNRPSKGACWVRYIHFTDYNPPRHQNVEIAEDILQIKVVEERADVLPETVNN